MGYLRGEGESFLLIQNKDRSKALLFLALKGLPRNPKTQAEIDEENGVETTGRFRLPITQIIGNSRNLESLFEVETPQFLYSIHSVYDILEDLGICSPEILSEEKGENREVGERRYLRYKVNDLANIISSIYGIEEVHIKIVPKPGYWPGACTAAILLDMKPGTNLNGEQIRTIRYLASVYIEGLDVDGIAICDKSGIRFDDNMEDSP